MNPDPKCPSCGGALVSGSPEGLCPACLLKAALEATIGIPPPPEAVPELEELQKLFPDLEIRELIGKGGMGMVYLVRQPSLDRLAALKILPVALGARQGFRERFQREARTLAALNHPNIVTIHDFGERGGYFYFLMEYVDGGDLGRILQAHSLTPKQALAIVPPVCEALQYAHDRGVVHRDIKPANILLDKSGRPKIADFGVAKLVRQPGDPGVPADYVLGTPAYMAPEQRTSSQEVDHRADIYSMGVLLYELLTGGPPQGPIEPVLRKLHIDVRLDDVVLRALEVEPQRRYQHVSELREGVERVLLPKPRRSRARWVAAVAIILLGCALAFIFQHRKTPGDGLPPVRKNSLGMCFRPLPGTPHWLSIWETRIRDWQVFQREQGWGAKSPSLESDPNLPVSGLDQGSAEAFCRWLTRRERGARLLADNESYRLPTDAEWSLAAGLAEPAGPPSELHLKNRTAYPWGTTAPAPPGAGNYPDSALQARLHSACAIPSYYDGYAMAAPVGSFPPNTSGFFDLGGNLWEETLTPGAGGTAVSTWRGGSWFAGGADGNWDELLLSFRKDGKDLAGPVCGFRILLDRSSPNAPTDLLGAVRAGDEAAVRKGLADHGDANTQDIHGVTPLMAAVAEGTREMVSMLLAAGADPKVRDEAGRSAIHFAARRGDAGIVRLVLDNGGDPRARADDLSQPLHAAAAGGHLAVMQILAEAGGMVEVADANGNSPLMLAALCRRNEAIDWLLEHGADPKAASQLGGDVLSVCALLDNPHAVAALLDHGAGVDQALLVSAGTGRSSIFSMLLARAPEPLPEDLMRAAAKSMVHSVFRAATRPGEQQELFRAVFLNLAEIASPRPGEKAAIVRLLHSKGVPLDGRDSQGYTPFLSACYNGEAEVVKVLLELGADKNAADNEGFTGLHSAAEQNHAEVVDLLLASGCDPKARTKDGRSVLASAMQLGHAKVVGSLLRAGCDPNDTNAGIPLLGVAAQGGAPDLVALLLEHGARPDAISAASGASPLAFACLGPRESHQRRQQERALQLTSPGETKVANVLGTEADYLECVKLLLAQGGAGKAVIGLSPLHTAAQGDFVAAGQLLLDHGLAVDALDLEGKTPLAHAVASHAMGMARLLLDHQASVKPLVSAESPLHAAARVGSVDMIALLLERGAEVNARDAKGATPLHWAILRGNEEAVRLLTRKGADLAARDFVFQTPLHVAAQSGTPGIVTVLLEAGADPRARECNGATPSQVAELARHPENAGILRTAEARLDQTPSPRK